MCAMARLRHRQAKDEDPGNGNRGSDRTGSQLESRALHNREGQRPQDQAFTLRPLDFASQYFTSSQATFSFR